jgi:hypothetical protein
VIEFIAFLAGMCAMNAIWFVVGWLDNRTYYKQARDMGEDD